MQYMQRTDSSLLLLAGGSLFANVPLRLKPCIGDNMGFGMKGVLSPNRSYGDPWPWWWPFHPIIFSFSECPGSDVAENNVGVQWRPPSLLICCTAALS